MKKVTLLLMGIINVIGIGLVSPVMTDFAADFPTVSTTMVAMVVTMPAITLLLGLAVCAWLVNWVQRKHLLMLGVGCVVLGGILPAFLSNFALILLARSVLGFGMGLGMPLQTTFFAEYPEDERAMLFGLNNGLGSIVSAGLLFLIALLQLAWRSAFLLYGLFSVVFICVICFIPHDKEKTVAEQRKSGEKIKIQLPFSLIFGYIAVFFVYAQYFIIPTTIAFYVTDHQLGGVAEAGLISGLGTLAMAIASLAFSFLRKWLKEWLTSVTLLVGAVFFVLYAFPVRLELIVISYCVIAMFAAVFPITVSMKITEALPETYIAVGSAIFTGVIFLGQFISPYYQAAVVRIIGGSTELAYIVFGGITFLLAGINVILMFKERNNL